MDCLPIGLRFMSAEDMLKIPSTEDFIIDRRYELMEDRSFLNEVVTRHLNQGNNYDLYERDEAEEKALNELEEKRRDWEREED